MSKPSYRKQVSDNVLKIKSKLKLFDKSKLFAHAGKWMLVTVLSTVVTSIVAHYTVELIKCDSKDSSDVAKDCNGERSTVTNVKEIVCNENSESVSSERYSSGLVSYKIEDKFPGGRFFTYHYKTNSTGSCVNKVLIRAHYASKESICSDSWGCVSNSMEFSSSVSNVRRLYAKGRYQDAVKASEVATNILSKLISKTPYSNYIFDWSMVNDITYIAEVIAEKAMLEGRYSEAKKIIKSCIGEWPIVPSRVAAIYFAVDILSGDKDWFSVRHSEISVSNEIVQVKSSYDTSYVSWEDSFEYNKYEVIKQLALWGYIYPILITSDGEEFYKLKYSDLLGLPDNLPYPRVKQKWGFGDYYGARWVGLGQYEEYNVSQELRASKRVADRLRRDGVVR